MTGHMTAPQAHRVASSRDPGARMHVMSRGPLGKTPVVMVHGFFQPASAILDVPGWSLQQALAGRGLRVVLFDLRGYGLSTRPTFMDEPAEASRPSLGCLADAVSDISDVVEHVCRTEGCEQVDLLGYSWGTARACAYSLQAPQRVRRTVLYAPVWRPSSGAAAEAVDPARAGQLNPLLGGYRVFEPGDLERQWDAEIGKATRGAFRHDQAVQAAERALMASDPALQGRGYRSPLGSMCDALEVAQGRPLFEADRLQGEFLLLRGDHDRLSSAEDASALFGALQAPGRRLVTIGQGTHLMHLEHSRETLIEEVISFLGASRGPALQAPSHH